jgi:glyoxylate/hydroxypyruvate reductase A
MAMMIVAKDKELEPWIKSFQELKSDLDIYVYPKIPNNDAIKFALVWSENTIDFKQYKNLRCIASMGAGVDHIIKNTKIKKDIYITKVVDEKLVSSMWEYLLTVVMNIVTNHYKYHIQQKQKLWQQYIPKSINEYTVGILGLGQLGSIVAKNFSKMGFNVKGYAKTQKNISNVECFTNLHRCIENVDIVINLLPLTDETKNILDIHLFKKLQTGAYIINVGRGEHLVENDLLKALDNNILSGAILDVFCNEPLEHSHPFWKHPNVIITPHSASITDPNSVAKQIIVNYERVSQKLKPNNIIDRDRGY